MTLLDLIRDLHAEGKPVVDYEIFICDNSSLDMEDVVRQDHGSEVSTPLLSPPIPPQYFELGEKPRFLYVETVKEYLRVTKAQHKIPKHFPYLLVGIFTDRTGGFLPRYRGKSWRDIPPVELFFLTQDGLVLPALDASGNLIGLVYDNEIGYDTPATFYTVRSIYGSEFAWQGDISRDTLPDGLQIVSE